MRVHYFVGFLVVCATVARAGGAADNVHHSSVVTHGNLRDLRRRNGGKPKSFLLCGTVAPTKTQVMESMEAVGDFYREVENDNDWNRRLQTGPIEVGVNFVIVSNETGYGNVTQARVDAQIAVLNAAYRPYFSFRLTSTQYVSNDTYFAMAIIPEGPLADEIEMKTRYRRGGPETLNVYSLSPYSVVSVLKPMYGHAYFPYPYVNQGVANGVVIRHEVLPGGPIEIYNYTNGYAEGDVRTMQSVPKVRHAGLHFHNSLIFKRCWCTRLATG
jgi:hypothetical protein